MHEVKRYCKRRKAGREAWVREEDPHLMYFLFSISSRRKAKEGNDIFGGEPSRQKLRRPEVGIRIFVPDYQAKKQREAQE